MDDKTALSKLIVFLSREYEDALNRYNLSYFDMGDYDAAPFWATRKADVKDNVGNMIFFAYLEIYGDSGEKKARIELDRIRKSSWESFMDDMVEKYHLPDSWKVLHDGSLDDLDSFFKMFAEYKKLHNE